MSGYLPQHLDGPSVAARMARVHVNTIHRDQGMADQLALLMEHPVVRLLAERAGHRYAEHLQGWTENEYIPGLSSRSRHTGLATSRAVADEATACLVDTTLIIDEDGPRLRFIRVGVALAALYTVTLLRLGHKACPRCGGLLTDWVEVEAMPPAVCVPCQRHDGCTGPDPKPAENT